MNLLHHELALAGAVLRCRDHPQLRSAISRSVARGELARPAPGIVAVPTLIDDPLTRLRIAGLWSPGDPLCLDAAAHLTITPRSALPHIVIAGRMARSVGGFEVQERRIYPEWIVWRGGFLATNPSLTVADQLALGRVSDLHDALRQRLVTLDSIRAALASHPGRPGNQEARRQLWAARQNPWSDGEALMHRVFRQADLRGWRGNSRIAACGNTYYGDAVFRRQRLIVELDGRDHHSSERDQRADRVRRNQLTATGWRIIVITMEMLLASPDETVALVRLALSRRTSQ